MDADLPTKLVVLSEEDELKQRVSALKDEKRTLEEANRYRRKVNKALEAESTEREDEGAADPVIKEHHADLILLQKIYRGAMQDCTELVKQVVPTVQGVNTPEPTDIVEIDDTPYEPQLDEEPDNVIEEVVKALAPTLIEVGPKLLMEAVSTLSGPTDNEEE